MVWPAPGAARSPITASTWASRPTIGGVASPVAAAVTFFLGFAAKAGYPVTLIDIISVTMPGKIPVRLKDSEMDRPLAISFLACLSAF